MRILLCFALLSVILPTSAFSQSANPPMRVERCEAIDTRSPINNIYIDDENRKWVSNTNGIYAIHSIDQSSKVDLAQGESSLISFPNGNFDLTWRAEQLKNLMGIVVEGNNRITCAYFDKKSKLLWVGTSEFGLYAFKVEANLSLKAHFKESNSKLKSNYINTIYQDSQGLMWVGTQTGVLYGKLSKWRLVQPDLDVRAFAEKDDEIWAVSYGDLFVVDTKMDWYAYDIDARAIDGDIVDIAFDGAGNIWVASGIISRYHLKSEEVTEFGPAEYFTSQYATCIEADRDGSVWVGTQDKGLFLIEKADIISVSVNVLKPVHCQSKRGAELRAGAVGGEPPYTYAWSTDATEELIKDIMPGTYELTITDSKGQQGIGNIVIPDPKIEVLLSTSEKEPVFLMTEVSGGQKPYTYRWQNGETGDNINASKGGTFNVTVTDANGCKANAVQEIARKAQPISVEVLVLEPVRCFGDDVRTISANISGGVAPYNFHILSRKKMYSKKGTDAEFVSALQTLKAGDYELTINDSEGTSAKTKFSIEEPPRINVSIQSNSSASAGKADGQATAKVSGGSGDYSYAWSNGENKAMANALAPGEHSLTVTDKNGCSAIAKIVIGEEIKAIAATITETAAIRCAGQSQAGLSVGITGGKGPFTYAWNNGQSGDKLSGIAAGSYELTITDAAGNSATRSFEVEEPKALSVTAEALSAANVNQKDGQAKAKVSGGTGNYTYAWDSDKKGATASGLSAGSHSLTVTDANGCTATTQVSIGEDIKTLSAAISQTEQIKCNGQSQASLSVSISGGKGPFTYAWNNGKSADKLSGIAAGSYELTVTDAAGNSTTRSFEVEEPKALAVSAEALSAANVNQKDGQAKAKVSGGTGSYTYAWDSGEKGATASGLSAGSHSLTVTDANGCTATTQVSIGEDIKTLSAAISQTEQIKCNGQSQASLSVSITGGKGPFTYAWNNGQSGDKLSGIAAGSYELTITDAAGNSTTRSFEVEEPKALSVTAEALSAANVNQKDGQAKAKVSGGTGNYTYAWDSGEKGATASGLSAGSHSVTVTDANGCTATAQVSIGEDIKTLSAAISQTEQIKCNGQSQASLSVSITGGKGPFTYAWNNGQSADKLSGIAAGSYELTVTDAAGNSATRSFELEEPKALEVTTLATAAANVNQKDGQAKATASGGTGSYTYAWENGERNAMASSLAAGSHSVTVTDANGCTATAQVSINEDIKALSAKFDQTETVRCNGESQASLSVTVTGGKEPFTYAWSNGQTGDQLSGLAAGAYSLTVTDAVGNTTTANTSIEQPEALAVQIVNKRPATDQTTSDGKASVTASGGVAPYTFAWESEDEGAEAKQLKIGQQSLTVTDANACTATLAFEIKKRILPELSAGDISAGQSIRMQKLNFEADSSRITPSSVPVVDEVTEFLMDNPKIIVEIAGHTNGIPDHAYANELSTSRAKSVADFIVAKGIDGRRVYYKGYGKRKPIATNQTEEGRAKNQRVEIKILEIEN